MVLIDRMLLDFAMTWLDMEYGLRDQHRGVSGWSCALEVTRLARREAPRRSSRANGVADDGEKA